MTHHVSELRDHLFDTLKELRSKEKPMEIARARAISYTAQTIIESAKVEVAFLKATDGGTSEFFDTPQRRELPPPRTAAPALPAPRPAVPPPPAGRVRTYAPPAKPGSPASFARGGAKPKL
jgi:hypothetical protein